MKGLYFLVIVLSLIAAFPSYAFAKASKKQAQAASKTIDSLFAVNYDNSSRSYYKLKALYKSLSNHIGVCEDLLVLRLDSKDDKVRQRVERCLISLSNYSGFKLSNQSIEAILGLLQSSNDVEEKCNLLRLLAKTGPQIKQVEQTIFGVIESTDRPKVKKTAVRTLSKLTKAEGFRNREKALKVFVDMLNEDVPSLRAAGASGLSSDQFGSSTAIDALVKALDDDYFVVRQSAAYSLRLKGKEAASAIPKLVTIAKTETGYGIRSYSLHALQSIGPDDPRVVLAFSEFLDDPNLAMTALNHILGLGDNASEIAPKVANFLTSKDRRARRYAIIVLAEIGTAEELPQLAKALKDSDEFVRKRAKSAIKKIKKK